MQKPTTPSTPAGRALRAWLRRTGTTQAALAKRAEMSTAMLSLVLSGQRKMSAMQGVKVAFVTGLPVSRLLDRETATALQLYVDRQKALETSQSEAANVA